MAITDWEVHSYSNGVTVWDIHLGELAVVYYAELDDGSGRAGIFALDDSEAHRAKSTVDKDAAERLAHRLAERVRLTLDIVETD